ncbi:glycosyltransferase [Altererythrobacter aquiaggeris]|uniref:glycosyltransferase n=1 Tax=Aestuarierythrobacter aquiaggeris TaxID=1898396 RepID=UPI00301925A3
MKLLHIIASVDRADGGPIEGVLAIGDELRKLGIEQSILTLDPPSSPQIAGLGRPVYAMGQERSGNGGWRGRVESWARFSPKAVAWAKQHVADYDAVVVDGLWNYATRVAVKALVGSTVPYVVFPHGTLDPYFRARHPLKHLAKQVLWPFNEGRLVKNAYAVLFTSEEEMMRARGTFCPYELTERVVPYGAAPPPDNRNEQVEAFLRAVPEIIGRKYILFLSRIHEKKGCDLLIEAFANVADDYPELDLVMAGPDRAGIAASLREQARGLGISERVHWPGMLLGDAKYGAYRGAEAFALPSHQENFGIVVAESLACGCPVLISDKVNIWREISAAGAGMVHPDTSQGTTEALNQFLAVSPEQKGAMRVRGERLFKQCFTWESATMNLLRELEKCTGRRWLNQLP